MMQLDDVVPATAASAERFEEATHRTTRWLDRCLAAHGRPAEQSLFAIVQGGTDPQLRDISLKVAGPLTILCARATCAESPRPAASSCMWPCMVYSQEGVHRIAGTLDCCRSAVMCNETVVQELTARQTPGYAIGGLVGGEEKALFVRTVSQVRLAIVGQRRLRFLSAEGQETLHPAHSHAHGSKTIYVYCLQRPAAHSARILYKAWICAAVHGRFARG